MSNIDKQQIRDDIAIRKSMPCFGVSPDHSLARLKEIQETQRSFCLEVVEALLDELEAKDKQIADQCGIIASARRFISEYAGLGDVGAAEFIKIIDRAVAGKGASS